MKRLTASELVRNFGEYSDSALTEPIIITRNGGDRLVLLNIEDVQCPAPCGRHG